MTAPSLTLPTHVAHAAFDEHWFMGHRVFAELVGEESLTSLLALSVTGRRFDTEERGVLDDVLAAWTIADPRIWPLKVTRLAASFGGTLEGLTAGILCTDCRYVAGWNVSPEAAALLAELDGAGLSGESTIEAIAAHVAGRRYLAGFGVPLRPSDERVPVIRRCLVRRGGRHQRRYWRLFERAAETIRATRGLEPNVGAAFGAVCLDLGLTPAQTGPLCIALGTHMFLANAIEGAAQAPTILQSLPAERIRYVGPPPRLSPRAECAKSPEPSR